MQCSWEQVSKKDHQLAADIALASMLKKLFKQQMNTYISFFYVAGKTLYH